MPDFRQRQAVVGLMPTRSMEVSKAIGGIASIGRFLVGDVFIPTSDVVAAHWQGFSVRRPNGLNAFDARATEAGAVMIQNHRNSDSGEFFFFAARGPVGSVFH